MAEANLTWEGFVNDFFYARSHHDSQESLHWLTDNYFIKTDVQQSYSGSRFDDRGSDEYIDQIVSDLGEAASAFQAMNEIYDDYMAYAQYQDPEGYMSYLNDSVSTSEGLVNIKNKIMSKIGLRNTPEHKELQKQIDAIKKQKQDAERTEKLHKELQKEKDKLAKQKVKTEETKLATAVSSSEEHITVEAPVSESEAFLFKREKTVDPNASRFIWNDNDASLLMRTFIQGASFTDDDSKKINELVTQLTEKNERLKIIRNTDYPIYPTEDSICFLLSYLIKYDDPSHPCKYQPLVPSKKNPWKSEFTQQDEFDIAVAHKVLCNMIKTTNTKLKRAKPLEIKNSDGSSSPQKSRGNAIQNFFKRKPQEVIVWNEHYELLLKQYILNANAMANFTEEDLQKLYNFTEAICKNKYLQQLKKVLDVPPLEEPLKRVLSSFRHYPSQDSFYVGPSTSEYVPYSLEQVNEFKPSEYNLMATVLSRLERWRKMNPRLNVKRSVSASSTRFTNGSESEEDLTPERDEETQVGRMLRTYVDNKVISIRHSVKQDLIKGSANELTVKRLVESQAHLLDKIQEDIYDMNREEIDRVIDRLRYITDLKLKDDEESMNILGAIFNYQPEVEKDESEYSEEQIKERQSYEDASALLYTMVYNVVDYLSHVRKLSYDK